MANLLRVFRFNGSRIAAAALAVALLLPGLAIGAPSTSSAPTSEIAATPTTLIAKKALLVKGKANWDSAFDSLLSSFKTLNAALEKQGVKPIGNPTVVYTSTDDTGFSYLAEVAVDRDLTNLQPPLSMGIMPAGPALKFEHHGSYDNMDNTYEAITNYLDSHKLEVKDTFVEEYLTNPITTSADKLEINVVVPIKAGAQTAVAAAPAPATSDPGKTHAVESNGRIGAVAVTLKWKTADDLDLKVICPNGDAIEYNNKSKCGGTLDIDSNSNNNAARDNSAPIENISWPAGAGAPGRYQIEAILYQKRSPGWPIEFTVEVRVDGVIKEQFKNSFNSPGKIAVGSFTLPAAAVAPSSSGPVATAPAPPPPAPPVAQPQAPSPAATIAALPPKPAASPPPSSFSSSPEFGRRIALVIGNSDYKNAPTLPNPARDAAAVGKLLQNLGFQSVALQTNLGREKMIDALRNFAHEAQSADWAVVYFAGHGMEVGGINYLLPVDASIEADVDMPYAAIPLDQVLNATDRAHRLRLVILDACRNNPFANKMARTASVTSRSVVDRGFARIEPDVGTLVIYAAKDGQTASDGDGANSPFTTALLKNLPLPGIEVRRLFDNVRDDVQDLTRQRQLPYTYGSVSGRENFYFQR